MRSIPVRWTLAFGTSSPGVSDATHAARLPLRIPRRGRDLDVTALQSTDPKERLMQDDSFATSRRTGLAGAAAFFLTALTRSAVAGDPPVDVPPPCCGNGPPNCAKFGTGLSSTLDPIAAGSKVEFGDPKFGKKASKGTYFWVFVADPGISAAYFDPMGNPVPPISYPVTVGFVGTAFAVQPQFTLDLQWPAGHVPIYSTRPIENTEGTP
jgi:hypothetical protein